MGKKKEDGAIRAKTLSAKTRQLVAQNIGLVGLHLRRTVPELTDPKRDREWDDLFQEGCLGLIRAAIDFDPESGISFTAFALARIQNAVRTALETRFTTIQTPRRRHSHGSTQASNFDRADPASPPPSKQQARDASPRRPTVFSYGNRTPVSRRKSTPLATEIDVNPVPTIGDHVRRRLERTVRRCSEVASRRNSTREDRRNLIKTITDDRLLIPDENHKLPLRQIARVSTSSSSRVLACERALIAQIRKTLLNDPEFTVLRRAARQDPRGFMKPIDADVEAALERAGIEDILRRFRGASPREQSAILHRVQQIGGVSVADWIEDVLMNLRPNQREKLLSAPGDESK